MSHTRISALLLGALVFAPLPASGSPTCFTSPQMKASLAAT